MTQIFSKQQKSFNVEKLNAWQQIPGITKLLVDTDILFSIL